MSEFTLTVLDTPGIQPYIFGSNRLRENIGASELVWRTTGEWALKAVQEAGGSNVLDPAAGELDDAQHIEDGALDAEVIYAGGGNVVVLFRERPQAIRFVTALSRKLLEEAPGLALAVAHTTVDWGGDRLGERVREAMRLLAQAKQANMCPTPLLGLGVTAACQSTGLVATTTNAEHGKPAGEDTYPISAEVAAKLEAVPEARQRLHDLMPEIQRRGYDIPSNFDDFGRSLGEMSYIAVVHADGNGIGRMFREIGESGRDSREYITRVRAASQRLDSAARAALRQVGHALLRAIPDKPDGDGRLKVAGKVPLRRLPGSDLRALPFRPVVYGGDDLTFVCDGRLGVALAAHYLDAFEQETGSLRPHGLHACAGVAVVKVHYPFARAYQLAGALAANAKQFVRENSGGFSALDWHFAAGGLLGGVQQIRQREFQVGAGCLTMRPLRLRDQRPEWATWPHFTQVVTEFETKWAHRRNKVIALRAALRDGPDEVERFLTDSGETLPILDATVESLQRTGWAGHRCGYFDAIEALDFYAQL